MGIIVRVFKSRQKLLRDNLTPFPDTATGVSDAYHRRLAKKSKEAHHELKVLTDRHQVYDKKEPHYSI